MESVWWVFKQLFDKGLVYRGFKASTAAGDGLHRRCRLSLARVWELRLLLPLQVVAAAPAVHWQMLCDEDLS
jgi:hypothetical protein